MVMKSDRYGRLTTLANAGVNYIKRREFDLLTLDRLREKRPPLVYSLLSKLRRPRRQRQDLDIALD